MPLVKGDVEGMSIDNLVRSFREASGQVAINQATAKAEHPDAGENLRLLDENIRHRLHVGASDARTLQGYTTGH